MKKSFDSEVFLSDLLKIARSAPIEWWEKTDYGYRLTCEKIMVRVYPKKIKISQKAFSLDQDGVDTIVFDKTPFASAFLLEGMEAITEQTRREPRNQKLIAKMSKLYRKLLRI
jgi:hypothetical protein